MHVRTWGWLCLSLVLVACPPKPVGRCGGNVCTAEQRCEAESLVCVNDDAPVITVTPMTGVVRTPTFELTGTMKDDVKVTAATWRIGTGAATPIEVAPNGSFFITLDAPLLDSQRVVITLRAQDQRVEVTKDVTVMIDRVGPAFRVVRPVVGSVIGAPTFEFLVAASDGSGSLATLKIDGVSISAPQSGAQVTQTIAVPATANGTPLELELIATDAAGNETRERAQFIGDRVAPEVAFVTPMLNQYVITERFEARVVVVEPSPISSALFQFGGATVVATEVAPGQWGAELTTALVEQDQVIRVEVTDAAGNSTSLQTTVKVDRIAPTLSVASPAPASIHRAAIALTVSTSQGTSQVTAALEGQQVTLTGGPTSWAGSLPIPQRDFSAAMVRVTALDLAGNSRVVTVPIWVDTLAPVIAFTAPSAGQKFNAAQLAANPNVTVTWSVTDADVQAGTTTINGAAGTGTTRQVATSAADNPASYTTTVVAADRAGNSSTASVSFSADRVVPTILNWEPAANARNVDRTNSLISFSEPVFGALTTSPGLVLPGYTPAADGWFVAHAWYLLPLDTFGGQVLEVTMPSMADEHGNALAPITRRFHLTASFPYGNTDRLIKSGVREFDATSDSDGVLSVGLITLQGNLLVAYKDVAINSPQLTFPSAIAATTVAVNSWNVVNPTTLQSSHRLGVTTYNALLGTNLQYGRSTFVDGVIQAAPVSSGPAATVSRPPVANEPVPASELFGGIVGTQYTRNTISRTLPYAGVMTVAQSNDSWAAFTTSATKVSWSHYRCRSQIIGGYYCAGLGYGANTSAPSQLQAAMTPAGSCLAVSWSAGGVRQAAFQPLTSCDILACFEDTNLPLSAVATDTRVAPFGANGENTLIFSFRPSTNELRLSKMTAGTCGPAGTTISTLTLTAPAKAHMPIRAGNKPAVLYISSTDELRLWVP